MAGITKFGDATGFVTLNRNKRSLILDLKSEPGRAGLYRLVEGADVLVQNFRPRVAVKLGIDYATLAAINPRLVYARISGYGEDGPTKDRPGQDLLVQSFGGLTMNAGRASGPPARQSFGIHYDAGNDLFDYVTPDTRFSYADGCLTILGGRSSGSRSRSTKTTCARGPRRATVGGRRSGGTRMARSRNGRPMPRMEQASPGHIARKPVLLSPFPAATHRV